MRWLEVAWAEIGQLEVSGSGSNPQIIGYFKAVGRADIVADEVAWCAAFAGAALLRAGISLDRIKPSSRLLANSYLSIGTKIDQPRVGALCVLSRGSNAAYGHVGFVVGWTDRTVTLLGGNQANSVSVQEFPRSRIRGLCWPEPPPTAKDMTSSSRIAGAQQQIVRDTGKIGISQPTAPIVPDLSPLPEIPSPDAIAAKASGLQSAIETTISFVGFLGHRWPWVVAACGAYWLARICYNAWRSRQWRLEDAATGKTPLGLARPPIEPGLFDSADDTPAASRPPALEVA